MSTPSDELRTAAETLRELAAKATADICPDWIYSAVRHVARNCQIECSHDDHQDWDQPEWDRYADAAYIAAMHPGVGRALADWLMKLASFCDDVERTHGTQPPADNRSIIDALAVSRAINGSAS